MLKSGEFGQLRALLSQEPSPELWKELCEELESWPCHEQCAAVHYTRGHLEGWKESLRVAPYHWWKQHQHTPHPCWPMVSKPPSYKVRFEKMFEELEQHPMIELDTCAIREGNDSELSHALEQATRFQYTPPQDLLEFYQEIGTVRLMWNARIQTSSKEDYPCVGYINIIPLKYIFDSWEGEIWNQRQHSQLHPFLRTKPIDVGINGACSALYTHCNEETIHYHTFGDSLYPTGLTFSQWLDRLLLARGHLGWLPSMIPSIRETQLLDPESECNSFYYNMPRLFEHFRPALFTPQTSAPPIIQKEQSLSL